MHYANLNQFVCVCVCVIVVLKSDLLFFPLEENLSKGKHFLISVMCELDKTTGLDSPKIRDRKLNSNSNITYYVS